MQEGVLQIGSVYKWNFVTELCLCDLEDEERDGME